MRTNQHIRFSSTQSTLPPDEPYFDSNRRVLEVDVGGAEAQPDVSPFDRLGAWLGW